MVYLSTVTDKLDPQQRGRRGITRRRHHVSRRGPVPSVERRADGGTSGTDEGAAPTDPISAPERRTDPVLPPAGRGPRDRFGHPIRTLVERPTPTLAITVPIVLGALVGQLPTALEGGFDATAVDDTIAVGAFGVLTIFAIAYELHRRRLAAIEGAVRICSIDSPASTRPACRSSRRLAAFEGPISGRSVPNSTGSGTTSSGVPISRRRSADRGRVGTRSISRVVTLLTESMKASKRLRPLSESPRGKRRRIDRLERERKQAMVEYMVVVYVSFLVFLFIIAVLAGYLIPNLPTGGAEPLPAASGSGISGLGGFSQVSADAYAMLFYHATLVQGTFSGVNAGQLSTGDVSGTKHAAAMISVLVFAILL